MQRRLGLVAGLRALSKCGSRQKTLAMTNAGDGDVVAGTAIGYQVKYIAGIPDHGLVYLGDDVAGNQTGFIGRAIVEYIGD